MPLKLSDLAAEVATLHLEFGAAGDLTIEYRPGLITERTMSLLSVGKITQPEQLTEMLRRFNEELCRLIVSWDLTGDDDQPIPLEPEALTAVPLEARVRILSELAGNVRMGEAKGSSSRKPSRAGRRSAGRATGSRR